MALDPVVAAKRLCKISNWTISNLKLQKLLYLAHLMYLGRTGKPLICDQFEAWEYGPVVPSLYHKVKIFGSDPISDIFHSVPDADDSTETEYLNAAYKSLSNLPAGKLVAITHWADGAWAKSYEKGARNRKISNEDIMDEYSARTPTSTDT
ncbi:MAG: DUF4065 domain-containing protein [Sneathiella sp.]|nr:DUF4065 domain-containing protein [Sneathiella sp.]